MENFVAMFNADGKEVLRVDTCYFMAYGDHSRIIGNVDGESIEVSGAGSAFCGLWDTVCNTRRSVKSIDDVAREWLQDHAMESNLCWREYIASLLQVFSENASNIEYCFDDTYSYCKCESFLREELESAIVRMVGGFCGVDANCQAIN